MSNKLYQTRVLRHISQYVIALKTGIQQSRISLIENELVTPREEEKQKIAKALGLKEEDIFKEC
jgi:transcriptional regulator with XRE-family HTH domain